MIIRPQWGVAAALAIAALALSAWFSGGKSARPPSPDLSSPESTVKSYWTLRAWMRRNAADEPAASGTKPSIAEVMSAVTAGGARDSFLTRPGTRDPLEWSLKRIEQTSDSTALAVARIRNLSREPMVITPTPIELFEAGANTEFHYLLARDANGWKVTEVWRVESDGKRTRVR